MERKIKKITIGSEGNEAKRSKLKEVDVNGEKWEGQSLETPKEKLDLNLERPVAPKFTTRRYDIAMPVIPEGVKRPTNAEILDHFRGQILALLWKDGWDQCGDMKTLMRKDGRMFHIFIPAKPLGSRSPTTHEFQPLQINENPYDN